ncbi:TPA: hypothetical protein ACH3X1_016535 [Trebouxia sp. C0004]
MLSKRIVLPLLLLGSGAAAVSIGLYNSATDKIEAFTDFAGNLQLNSVYLPENDLPEQRAALQELYVALGGDYWSAAYKQLTFVEEVEAIANASSASSANLSGTLPPSIFTGLPDLSVLFLAQNQDAVFGSLAEGALCMAGLTGQILDVPSVITADMLILQLQDTSLQNSCAEPVGGGSSVKYNSSCFSNLFQSDSNQTSTAANIPGLTCPSLHLQRPDNASVLTTAYFYNYMAADPQLYSYQGCSCTQPLVAYYYNNATSGLFHMKCVSKSDSAKIWAIVSPFMTIALVLLALLALYLVYRKPLANEWEMMRINGLKRRHAPGTLMERQGKGLDLFHSGMSIVMTDVEGSTGLWEWNSHIMNSALALHDHTLRSMLPKYFGYEVTTEGDAFMVAFHDPLDAIAWALHVQLALLEAPWPPELLQHAQARLETCPEGKLLFRGLRVRMAISIGIPAEIIVHNVTKQVEYRGEIIELSESLSHLPAGGQVLLSDTTSQRTAGRLHEIHLPAFTFQCAKSCLSRAQSKISFEGLRHAVSKVLVVSPSMKSTDELLTAGSTPKSAASQMSLLQAKRSSCSSFKQTDSNASRELEPQHRLPTEIHLDVNTEEPESLRSRFFHRAHACESAPETSTALASLPHSACIVIDMGSFLLSECRNRAYTADDAALPCIAGEHVRQILPEALVERATLFPPFDPASQVAPSFFDAPGAQAAGKVTPKQRAPYSVMTGPPATPRGSPDSTQRFSQDLPDIAFAFVSDSGYKEIAGIDKQQALIALGRFKSCVRTSLLLCDGYECQEKEGTFLVAFASPTAAVEWALTLHLALMRVPWGEALLSLEPAREEHDPTTGQVLTRGLSARVGIFHGPITRLCPHPVTGRAEYLGSAVSRASRLWAGCSAGQILVEQSLVDALELEWTGASAMRPFSAARLSPIALRNHALLVHRQEVDRAASQSLCSKTSLSGIVGRQLTLSKRSSTMARHSQSLPRWLSIDPGYVPRQYEDVASPLGSDVALMRRRSMSMGQTPGSRVGLVRLMSKGQDVSRDLKDFDEWRNKSGSNSLCSTPHADLATGVKVHDNAAFIRTGSGKEVLQSQDSKAGIIEAMARASAEGEKVSKPQETAPVASQTVLTDIPSTLVAVEVYHMGQYTYKGMSEKVQLCQVFPASLSERRQGYSDTAFHGKAVCLKRDDSLALSVQVKLPEVLQLPLSAEPPLCINMVL